MALLEVRELSKEIQLNRHSITILEDVNFIIEENEFVCIVGPSGCGKSTLLRLIAGLDRPTRGEVWYNNQLVTDVNPKIAFVFQSFALIPWLTVMENISLGLEAKGMPKEQRIALCEKFIDKVGLEGYEEAYPKELSGGMKQRVGLARALVMEPELLCMDEPFSALDALTATNLREEVLTLWQDETVPLKSILMVTHMVEEAVLLSDRVLVMSARPGRIISEVKIELSRPRNRKEPAFDEYADKIFSLILER